MINTNTEYWFALETYVYVLFKNDQVLLYNTLDGTHLLEKDECIVSLLRQIYEEPNGGVVKAGKEELQNETVVDFIARIRQLFMGDIYDCSLFKSKPVQLYPMLNFSRDVKKLKHIKSRSIGEQALAHLHEINIYPISENEEKCLSVQTIQSLLWQIRYSGIRSLNFHINIPETYPEIVELKKLLDDYPMTSTWYIPVQHIQESTFACLPSNSDLCLVTKGIIPESVFESVLSLSASICRGKCSFIFEIAGIEEYLFADRLIEKYNLETNTIVPIYNKHNADFFESEVFLTEEDVFADKLSLNELFSHQTLNTHDFGKLTLMPDGSIYANPKFPQLGNIATDSLYDVIYRELDTGKSWLRIRDQKPCSDCMYQWICPSPSDLELSMGKANMCHVK